MKAKEGIAYILNQMKIHNMAGSENGRRLAKEFVSGLIMMFRAMTSMTAIGITDDDLYTGLVVGDEFYAI